MACATFAIRSISFSWFFLHMPSIEADATILKWMLTSVLLHWTKDGSYARDFEHGWVLVDFK